MKTVSLQIADIQMDESPLSRAELRQDVILAYAERMQEGDRFPPITVFRTDEGKLVVADGWLRLLAIIHCGGDTIGAKVHHGSRREAILYAVGANAAHGLPRTHADKRKIVLLFLDDEEWCTWSDIEIARRCRVSDRFVNKLRAELSPNRSEIENGQVRKARRGSSVYLIDTARIGQRPPPAKLPGVPHGDNGSPWELFSRIRSVVDLYCIHHPAVSVDLRHNGHEVTVRIAETNGASAVPCQPLSEEEKTRALAPVMNQIMQGDCLDLLPALPDESIDFICTDPPYNVGMPYADYNDNLPYPVYLEWMREVLGELLRVSRGDGRLCLNLPTKTNRGGAIRCLYSDMTQVAASVGWHYHSEISWHSPIFESKAWGSWCSPSSPSFIPAAEKIVLFAKHQWQKERKGEATIQPKEFIAWVTLADWTIDASERQTSDHPAILPLEIPRRLIKLLTFKHEVVLDPFAGTGSVLVSAQSLGRSFIGMELSTQYVQIAEERQREGFTTTAPGHPAKSHPPR